MKGEMIKSGTGKQPGTGKYSLSLNSAPKGSKGSTDKVSSNKYSLGNCK